MHDILRELGARDHRIFTESFGPASLRHLPDAGATAGVQVEEATEAIVEFMESAFEQPWNVEVGTLLELAESHGLSPAYGCRNGECGACKTRLVSGTVAYRQPPRAVLAADEVLNGCARLQGADPDRPVCCFALLCSGPHPKGSLIFPMSLSNKPLRRAKGS
jgi:ferredoxin